MTDFDNDGKITIGSEYPMYLENVEYSVIYNGAFAAALRRLIDKAGREDHGNESV